MAHETDRAAMMIKMLNKTSNDMSFIGNSLYTFQKQDAWFFARWTTRLLYGFHYHGLQWFLAFTAIKVRSYRDAEFYT